MFSVVNTLLYPPAPYPNAERVVRLFRTATEAQNWPMSLPDLRDAAEQSESFASITLFQWWSFSLAETGQPAEAVGGAIASGNLFTTLGVQPALGRGFTAEEQQAGRDRVAVISDHLWQHHFGGDPQLIGRQVRVNGENVEIIGVLPALGGITRNSGGGVDLWRPLPLAQDWRENRDVRWLEAIARLKPGMAPTRAQAELSAIASWSGAAISRHQRRPGPASRPAGWFGRRRGASQRLMGDARARRIRPFDRLREPRQPAARAQRGAGAGPGD